MAKLSNHPSGHKALIAHLLRGRRVRSALRLVRRPTELRVSFQWTIDDLTKY
jgi:hypothetical protein